ncbi:hypothetical protein DFH07DRAFT_776603 [Mycena maculata]|uniref:Uncharacterized protein n=1 Tax=Mycena maculata TaxID=230809 RepID=A0AAD7ILC8_9AGAR|nr:hypothetical protein DFH07DRAFT_776603 [Mycena maculata]
MPRNTSPNPPSVCTKQPARTGKRNDENRAPPKNKTKTKATTAGPIDPYSEEMEQKYNIEGCNVQEIVFLRQDNDRAQAQIKEQAAAYAKLQAEIAVLKARPSTFASDVTNQESAGETAGPRDEHDKLAAELEKAIAANTELQQRLAVVTAQSSTKAGAASAIAMIPRPAGSAGNDFNIQDAMGLESAKDRERYKLLMRSLRDLVLAAGIPWELPWAKVPVSLKDKFFNVAAKQHPILLRYENHWATEEIAKQYIKNKRRLGYDNGSLEVPAEYGYLKANSAKRDPSAPRGRKLANVDQAKKVAKKKNDVARKRAPRKTKKAGPSTSSKGKGKACVVDDDEEMSDVGAGEGEDSSYSSDGDGH